MNRARIQRPNSFLLLLSVAFLALGLLATTGCNNTQSSTTTPSAVTIHGTNILSSMANSLPSLPNSL
jgi:hypothetical protein